MTDQTAKQIAEKIIEDSLKIKDESDRLEFITFQIYIEAEKAGYPAQNEHGEPNETYWLIDRFISGSTQFK